jgi:hypothetical protein
MAHLMPAAEDGPVRMIFRITKNEFRGVSKWEVRAVDIIAPV